MEKYDISKSMDIKTANGNTLIFDTAKSKYYLLDKIETFILENITKMSIANIVILAKEKYEGSHIENDIIKYINELINNGIIEQRMSSEN